MRRLALTAPIVLVILAASGCGSSSASFTLKTSAYTLVATGDANTIAAEKARMPAGSTTDGDTHTGNKICETDVNDAGRNFHVVLYSATALPSSICDTVMNGINA